MKKRICELLPGDVYRTAGSNEWRRVERLLPGDLMAIRVLQISAAKLHYWYTRGKPVSHSSRAFVEVRE